MNIESINWPAAASVLLFLTFVAVGAIAPSPTGVADARPSVASCGVTDAGAQTSHSYNGSFQSGATVSGVEIEYSGSYVYPVGADDISAMLNGTAVSATSLAANTSTNTLSVSFDESVTVSNADNFSVAVDDVIHPPYRRSEEVTLRFRNSSEVVESALFATTYPGVNQTVHRPVDDSYGTFVEETESRTVFGFIVPGTAKTTPMIRDSPEVNSAADKPAIRFAIQSSEAQAALDEAMADHSSGDWVTEVIAKADGEPVPVFRESPSEYATENLDTYIVVSDDARVASVYHSESGSPQPLSVELELQTGQLDRFRAYGLTPLERKIGQGLNL